jgi:ribosomal protein S18 acetylase RimI-like enzyme
MKIRKATNKDIKEILRLDYELIERMREVIMKDWKDLGDKKGKFYSKINKLGDFGKIGVSAMMYKQIRFKKTNFTMKEFEKEFDSACRLVLTKPDVEKSLREMEKMGFISRQGDKIKNKIPFDEAIEIQKKVSKEIFVDYLSKRKGLAKINTEAFHLVAEEKGKLLGYLEGYISEYSDGSLSFGELSNLVVSEGSRGKGVGSKLVKDFLEICKKKKVGYLQVVTPKNNKDAIKFYKKMGFKPHGGAKYMYWSSQRAK